jgi:hypothetical protein
VVVGDCFGYTSGIGDTGAGIHAKRGFDGDTEYKTIRNNIV